MIKNLRIYGLEESLIRSGYPMMVGEVPDMHERYVFAKMNAVNIFSETDITRGLKLAKNPGGTGHDNFLKGVLVQFDLQYAQYITPQLQRYGHIDIISSQSKMHRLTSVSDIKSSCNKWVVQIVIDTVNSMIGIYNNENTSYPFVFGDKTIINKSDMFHLIISNLPMGYQLWMGITTNYMQLKTIYKQRKNHKLEDWHEFCDWVETLPHSKLITNK